MKKTFVLLAVLLAGCGSNEFQLVPISGTVTFDGEPLEGAEVVFAPMEREGTVNVGVPSVGMTDAEGKYYLKPVRGQGEGAIVARHRVSVDVKGIDEVAISAKVENVTEKNRNMSAREIKALRRKVRQDLEKGLKGQKEIPRSYNKNTRLKFEVTEATDGADFDLMKDGK